MRTNIKKKIKRKIHTKLQTYFVCRIAVYVKNVGILSFWLRSFFWLYNLFVSTSGNIRHLHVITKTLPIRVIFISFSSNFKWIHINLLINPLICRFVHLYLTISGYLLNIVILIFIAIEESKEKCKKTHSQATKVRPALEKLILFFSFNFLNLFSCTFPPP